MTVSHLERLADHLARLDKPLHDLIALRYGIRNQVDATYLAELDRYIGELTELRRMLWEELMAARGQASEGEQERAAEVFYAALYAEARGEGLNA